MRLENCMVCHELLLGSAHVLSVEDRYECWAEQGEFSRDSG